MPRSAFNVAWHASLPVLFGYLILGLGYGLYMHNLGFAWWYPPLMAATIYGGSVEFVIATMLTQHFNPCRWFSPVFLRGQYVEPLRQR